MKLFNQGQHFIGFLKTVCQLQAVPAFGVNHIEEREWCEWLLKPCTRCILA